MEKIPFSLPLIDQDVVNEMNDTLLNTGWLTSGPKVQILEKILKEYIDAKEVLCVNSWTSGAMLILKWFGVGAGDEVIIPAYTYSATALAVLNIGAKPIMVDVNDDFTINIDQIKNKINSNTKAIIPVDLGGWPCDYDKLFDMINSDDIISKFNPKSERQEKLGRILIMSDAAHSLGAIYKNKNIGTVADITIFSLHSVKNITTGEGGAICLNLNESFDNKEEHKFLKCFSLNGQNKTALEKNQNGGWRYDIIDQGLKVNMPDICASVGIPQMKKYKSTLLPERISIFEYYNNYFSKFDWAITPLYKNEDSISSCHLYLLRFENISETQRDEMIKLITEDGIGVNVHYIPMAMLTLFKKLGYKIEDYPNTYNLYHNLITLPVYNGLSEDKLSRIVHSVSKAYETVIIK